MPWEKISCNSHGKHICLRASAILSVDGKQLLFPQTPQPQRQASGSSNYCGSRITRAVLILWLYMSYVCTHTRNRTAIHGDKGKDSDIWDTIYDLQDLEFAHTVFAHNCENKSLVSNMWFTVIDHSLAHFDDVSWLTTSAGNDKTIMLLFHYKELNYYSKHLSDWQ